MSRQITISTPSGAVTVNEKTTYQRNYGGNTYNEKSAADAGGTPATPTPTVRRRRIRLMAS